MKIIKIIGAMPIPGVDKCLTSPSYLKCSFTKDIKSLEVKVSAYKSREAISNGEVGLEEYQGITIPIPAPIIVVDNKPVVLKSVNTVIEDHDHPDITKIVGIDFSDTEYEINSMKDVNYTDIIPDVNLEGINDFVCGLVKQSIEAGYASKLTPDADGYTQIKEIKLETL